MMRLAFTSSAMCFRIGWMTCCRQARRAGGDGPTSIVVTCSAHLAGHHGRPPQEPEVAPGRNVLCEGCLAAAGIFVEAMRKVFRPSPLTRPMEQHDVARLGWHLAGLVTLADWLGSRQAWFPYVPTEAVADPAAYFWSHALPRAAAALAASGLAAVAPAPFAGLRRLFPAHRPCRRRCNAGQKP